MQQFGSSCVLFQTRSYIPLFKKTLCIMNSEKTKLFTSILVCRPAQDYSLLDSFSLHVWNLWQIYMLL